MSCILILAQASSGILDSAKETADTFGWNLWQFLSQVISFTIVALLLRRFAYTPILKVLEERRQQIAEGLLNAEKIKKQLAEAEQRHAEILAKANAVAQKMIDEARESSAHIAERKQQEAVANNDGIETRTRAPRRQHDGESDRQSSDARRPAPLAGRSSTANCLLD
jgi:F-type H+-transporting ATPase subunit b